MHIRDPTRGAPPKISKKPPSYIIRICAEILNIVKMNKIFSPTDQKAGIRSNLHSSGSVPSHEAHEVLHLSLHVSLWSLAHALFWPQHTFADQQLFSALWRPHHETCIRSYPALLPFDTASRCASTLLGSVGLRKNRRSFSVVF